MREETDVISLNAVDLVIKTATVQLKDDSEVHESVDIAFCPAQETVTIKFPTKLSAGTEGTLSMSFSGNLNDKMKGFYRSKYYTPSGEERYGGVTQL